MKAFEKKTDMDILITGASRGIGAELAKKLAESKHKLLLLSRNTERLNDVTTQCKELYNNHLVYPITFDLAKLEDNKDELIDKISAITNQIDVLVNNAGYLINKPFLKIDREDEMAMFQTNYFAPALLTRTLFSFIKRSKHSSIINIATMGAVQGASKFSGLATYSASKAALVTLTECLAEEFKEFRIRANALAIGAVDTEMFNEAFPGIDAGTTPEEMAEFIKWFVEEGYKRFNGKLIPVSDSTP
ncbi:MAG TPA: SDR family oxidoreductase [Bacteroidales bacterium]|nr:SDR family oxidoreductase [Bacteroidales bacterium]